jgi:pilus assembly protein FimV
MATIAPFMSAPAAGAGGASGSAGSVSAGHGGGGAGGSTAGAGGSGAAGPITGSAVFTATSTGVDVVVTINGCVDAKSYPVHIHEGSSCADVASQGAHWGAAASAAGGSGGSGGAGGSAGSAGSGGAAGAPAMLLRGEGIPEIMCKGTTGTSMLSRANTDPKLAWSVGGDMTTNVVGHVVVVHDPVAKTPRIACGKITM